MVNTLSSMEREPAIEIGFAKSGDGPGIAAVQKVGWFAAYPDTSVGLTKEDIEAKDFDSQEQLRKWEEAILRQNAKKQLWVARSGKRIVGFSVGVKEDENELKAIYVLPEYHGRGVGKLLIEPAMKWLGNEKDVVVWVFSHNNQAIRFYEKHGFVKSGKTSTWPVNGKPIPDLEMVKKCDARH